MKPFSPNSDGFYGQFGGAFIPEMLRPNIEQLKKNYLNIIQNEDFQKELNTLLIDYVGRPTPLFFSSKLSELFNAHIFLKREDLNHTGAHKINNALGQVLLAKRMNKSRIIAETGAGQHGVATATACAILNMECVIFMGKLDTIRQKHNVERMQMLGAEVVAVSSGSQTLKDATNEALREWIRRPNDTHYVIGSVVGPHPYPDLVTRFQSIISHEISQQLQSKIGKPYPDTVIACVGGGSNAMGAFYHFINNNHTQLIAVEASGLGIHTNKTAAAMTIGDMGVLHGSKTMIMQDENGQIIEPHSISAGLDYPGIGPALPYLLFSERLKIATVTDEEAVQAGVELTKKEGILPALESAHAIAYLNKHAYKKDETIVICLSGRGDKDLETYLNYSNNEK